MVPFLEQKRYLDEQIPIEIWTNHSFFLWLHVVTINLTSPMSPKNDGCIRENPPPKK